MAWRCRPRFNPVKRYYSFISTYRWKVMSFTRLDWVRCCQWRCHFLTMTSRSARSDHRLPQLVHFLIQHSGEPFWRDHFWLQWSFCSERSSQICLNCGSLLWMIQQKYPTLSKPSVETGSSAEFINALLRGLLGVWHSAGGLRTRLFGL